MFKKIIYFVSGLMIFMGLGMAQAVSAQASGERVVSFDASAHVEKDRAVKISETISYDFGLNGRHGIYRTIPEVYSRNGGSYRLRLNVVSVYMDGKPATYRITSRTPNLKIQIGDADSLVSGQHTYQISYQTNEAINFFSDHDELYWNVTGNDWEVPIEKTSFEAQGPEGFDATVAKDDCFIGMYGSSDRSCEIKAQGGSVWYQSKRSLAKGEGMTIVLGFPKGLILEPTWKDRLLQFIGDNWIAILPFIVFMLMYRYWYINGREPKGRGTVIPQYEPPRGLTPMEMTVLETQSNQPRTVTATIIDLARRGYLKINYTQKQGVFSASDSYSFDRLKEADESLETHERTLLNGMFKGDKITQDLDGLKGKFYSSITSAQGFVYSTLRRKGFFKVNPITIRSIWMGSAAGIGTFGLITGTVFHRPAIWFVSFILSAFIVGIIGWFMPRKTVEGAIALEEVEGFKWFLSVTEKDRLAFHNAPAVKPEQFHEFLSYAIAFGVEDQWAKQFEGLSIPEPSYVSGYGHMNPILFAHAMHNFGGDFSKTFTPPSNAGSGGSGFSGGGVGGGFGGGGGGSW